MKKQKTLNNLKKEIEREFGFENRIKDYEKLQERATTATEISIYEIEINLIKNFREKFRQTLIRVAKETAEALEIKEENEIPDLSWRAGANSKVDEFKTQLKEWLDL